MLICKDSGKFFHDCIDCEHYKECTYFDKNKTKEMKNILLLCDNAIAKAEGNVDW